MELEWITPTPPPDLHQEGAGTPGNRALITNPITGQAWNVYGSKAEDFRPIPIPNFAFMVSDASDADGYKVRVLYGEVVERTGTTDVATAPTGMAEGIDFILVVNASDEVYVAIAYDSDTLVVTEVTCAAGDMPDDEVGSLHVRIGHVYEVPAVGDSAAHIEPYNTHCGDIVIALRYVTLDGALYLQGYNVFGTPVEIPPE